MSIKKFRVGEIIDCNSVVKNITEEKGEIPYFKREENKLIYGLDKKDLVYGLGENVRGINKRGWIFESYCTDDPNHAQDKRSLYGAHNFIVIYGVNKSIGIFIDTPAKVKFDIGYTDKDVLEIEIEKNNYDLYIIEENDINNIVKEFRKLIGMNYVPPKWAFGYQQSRWSYGTADEVREIGKTFREKNIPIDCIYLDIDYMKDFKNFSINNETFPKFEELVEEMKNEGIRLIPIIDAGCKIEEGYDIYEEGIEKGHYCLDKEGNPFVAAVWPGKVHFPDFLNKDARLWFGKKYKFLTDKGIEGFWNDMNEPAIFYSEEGLKKAFEFVEESKNKNLDIYSFFELKDKMLGLSNSNEDYNSFYHNVDGQKIKHNDIHNLYGHNMTRAAAEGLDSIDENKRFLLFSRASSIGMHRYGGIWTGDNTSLWEHLEMNVKMMPNLNMCGYLYTGADTGGFGGNCTADLLIRWFQFSIFTPLFRNHSAMGTRKQEPFAFGLENEKTLKNIIDIRYALIPYIYSEYMKATNSYDSMFKPLSFEYKDLMVREIEDQILMGDSLMLTPIVKQNANGRYVYLPEEMLLVKGKSLENLEYKVMEKGHHYIEAELDEVIFFIRKDKMLVLGEVAESVQAIDEKTIKVKAFIETEGSYTLYNDDGISKDYINGIKDEIKVVIKNKDKNIDIKIETTLKNKVIEVEVYTKDSKIIERYEL
ncbi:TIM-barrel domain-containing protein [uncultured Clostridium sp.]|uniref:TIM-barrel domain-containing protein n=1 Tax=uncultured Clostridium sp. TaxID=59620 RepID=UPI00261E1210|nr:TIM-barrel domain-containing protein [uncultured Clostridium sp.]